MNTGRPTKINLERKSTKFVETEVKEAAHARSPEEIVVET